MLNVPLLTQCGDGEAESDDEGSNDEDEIWAKTSATGRQTFGGFKRSARHKTATSAKPAKDDADADLSSASEDDEQSDSDTGDGTSSGSSRQPMSRHSVGGKPAFSPATGVVRQNSNMDTASPLRRHAQEQAARKRKHASHAQGGRGERRKLRKTM